MSNAINFSQFTPFNMVSRQFLSEVAVHAKVHSAPKGAMIFKRSKEQADSYYLVEGEVDLIDNEYSTERIEAGSLRAKLSLNTETPSQVSAVAKTAVRYFSVKTRSIERMITASQKSEEDSSRPKHIAETDDWMGDLLQCPVFSKIPSRYLQNLFTKFEKVYAQCGETIVKEGDPGDYFYVISSGSVEITNHAGNVCVILKAGEYFGAEALISDSPRNATVKMCDNGILQRLNAEDFAALIQKPALRYIDPASLYTIENDYKVIDVRMPIEYRMAHFPGSINVPISRLRKTIEDFGPEQTYLISDEAGARTDVAAYILCQAGLDACILSGAGPDQRLSQA